MRLVAFVLVVIGTAAAYVVYGAARGLAVGQIVWHVLLIVVILQIAYGVLLFLSSLVISRRRARDSETDSWAATGLKDVER